MTPIELYNALDNAGIEYEIVEIFEGSRVLIVSVEEENEEETEGETWTKVNAS